MKHANELLGYGAFDLSKWEAVGEYDEYGGKHQAFVVPKEDLQVEDVTVRKGERVRIEESYKYSQAQANELWQGSGVEEAARWNDDAAYGWSILP